MNTPNTNEQWIHLKTGNIYTVIRMCRLHHPETGRWLIGVTYTNAEASDMFVRECFGDFMVKFKRMGDE